MGQQDWAPDFLGPGFEARALGDGSHGPLGVLVRHMPAGPADPEAPPHAPLVYVHGWSDYFFNAELARFSSSRGRPLYALDLPGHGRSLAGPGTPGFVGSSGHYLESVGAAVQAASEASGVEPVLMGHSAGGLAAALFAQREPGALAGLVLSSPWLVPHLGDRPARVLEGVLGRAARTRPEAPIPLPPRGHYWRAVAREAGGEWDLDAALRPRHAFPVRVGWLHGVLEAQRSLRAGPAIEVPTLLLASASSDLGLFWRERMRRTDAVLPVGPMLLAAGALCRRLEVARIEGGLHDVLLSAPGVRREAYARLAQWLEGV
ncbi:alpha/beta hydrolase [Sinomonas halotolerans]|uniref:Alpha/beta hydrolase n=1 Tax=Sinomonas halotolerans TaxID=1644133 RepID=A0ABU9X0V1_9MICC